VGDSSDGYPGIPGIGPAGASRLLNTYGPLEEFPYAVLGERQGEAELYKLLATLRTDAPLFASVDALEWRGPTPEFAAWTARMGDERLLRRANRQ
jgi:5'-3' exonuclease